MTELIRHGGDHTMVDITVDDGTVIEATDEHPFWSASRGQFVFAIDLEVGELVLGADGDLLAVTETVVHSEDLLAYNLAIEGIHTYYAGETPVLVHNTCGPSTFAQAKSEYGSPGPGNVYDHVVEQSQIARSGFSPEQIHGLGNLNPVSAQVNQLKANWYFRSVNGPGSGTIRDWLTGQSFEAQLAYGKMVTREILRGLL